MVKSTPLKSGRRFSKLTVMWLERTENKNNKNFEYYRCKCDCGNEIVAFKGNLTNDNTKSCGCLVGRPEIPLKKGTRFGNLVVIELNRIDDKGLRFYKCECDCGNEVVISKSNLTSGNSSTCGCRMKLRKLPMQERIVNKINKVNKIKVVNEIKKEIIKEVQEIEIIKPKPLTFLEKVKEFCYSNELNENGVLMLVRERGLKTIEEVKQFYKYRII